MGKNNNNTGFGSKFSWEGFNNFGLISKKENTFANRAACTLQAIQTLIKTDDPDSRLYPIFAYKTEQITSTPVQAQYDLTKKTLYNTLTELKYMLPDVASSDVTAVYDAWNDTEAYVYLVTNKEVLKGISLDGTLIKPILCTVNVSIMQGQIADSKYLVFSFTPLNPNTFEFKEYTVEVAGLISERGFQNVDLTIETSPAAIATTFYSKVMTSGTRPSAVGGLANTDFVLKSSGGSPKTITTTVYQGSGIYKHTGTAFATGDVLSLAPPSTITMRYEATGTATMPSIA